MNSYEAAIQANTDRQVNDYGYDRNTAEGKKKIEKMERRIGRQTAALNEKELSKPKTNEQKLIDALKNYNSDSNK